MLVKVSCYNWMHMTAMTELYIESATQCCKKALKFFSMWSYSTSLNHNSYMSNTCLTVVFLSAATPMSLQQLSRLAVRKKLGTRALKVIGQLHIPKLIISYLCYQWGSAAAGVGSALKERLTSHWAAPALSKVSNKVLLLVMLALDTVQSQAQSSHWFLVKAALSSQDLNVKSYTRSVVTLA